MCSQSAENAFSKQIQVIVEDAKVRWLLSESDPLKKLKQSR